MNNDNANVNHNSGENTSNTFNPNTLEGAVPNNVTTSPVMESTVSVDSNPTESNDSGAVVNENLKKVEINYTPPSKFKIFCLILFFVFLIGFVLFLPEITSLVRQLKSGELNQVEEKIVTGKMSCTLNSHTTNLDKNYDVQFSFTDNRLDSTQIIITTKGDVTLDEEVLDNLAAKCRQLAQNVSQLSGVGVSCDYTNGQLVEKQTFQLRDLNEDELNSAFIEAGVNNPGYIAGEDMDFIESNMSASKYVCERTR